MLWPPTHPQSRKRSLYVGCDVYMGSNKKGLMDIWCQIFTLDGRGREKGVRFSNRGQSILIDIFTWENVIFSYKIISLYKDRIAHILSIGFDLSSYINLLETWYSIKTYSKLDRKLLFDSRKKSLNIKCCKKYWFLMLKFPVNTNSTIFLLTC